MGDIIEYLKNIGFKETNVVDHCNLNCKGYANFSNIQDNNYVNLVDYERDIKLISQKFNIYCFRILGVEPLLHPKFSELLNISVRILPSTKIVVF